MTTHVLHFGKDDCHRVSVLETAGYRVRLCASLSELQEVLESGPAPEAVFVTEMENSPFEHATMMVQTLTSVPVILFRTSYRKLDETRFDLVIPTLTRPPDWLAAVDTILSRSAGIPAQSGLSKPGTKLRSAERSGRRANRSSTEDAPRPKGK